ncbi:uncharacterized protein LOC106671045 isoform X2 [Cimex lectularius]|uniref:Myofilin n=1 Tax=Cimex lectularius TaxID=79782 RepID=A0A8I6S3B9_CIMLE|nr:uncharacterized protein LOC106671045 isoform X2 [Cimex lectularius]
MLLHNHLDMIGRNEPIQRKAKFWQSYVRALKGTDDIRAPEASHYSRYPSSRGLFRPLLDSFPTWPHVKSMYDDPIAPSDRISVPGYRYLPISRETYGLSPRNIYPHHYSSLDRYPRTEYYYPFTDWDRLDRQPEHKYLNPAYRKPFVKEYTIGPDGAKVPLYTYTGTPIYSRGGITRRPLTDLFSPRSYVPLSRYTRDPWWWSYPSLKPFESLYSRHSPFYLRDSYLSPVKNTYLWRDHPFRAFSTPRLYY